MTMDDDISLSLSDEDMLLCCDDDEDVAWSDASEKHGAGGKNSEDKNNGRSRRLLSLEQSKVLYKILEKTHFPSTQLRESVATQLGVSPRKVQVWFQNRRQVGKKRMIEAVHSYLNVSTANASPRHHVNISLEVLSDTLKATGKGRFSPHEDERTRAWRKHTIRLALNPGAMENSGTGAGMEDDFEPRGFPPAPRYGGEGVRINRGFYAEEALGRNRALHGMSRSVGALRINVPRIDNHTGGMGMGMNSAKTPTYTGPGSATHLETLTALHRGLPPLTPAAIRSSIVPPAIVSSQKELFTLHPHHHHQQQQQREQHYGPGGGVRVRSATLAVPAVGDVNVNGGRNANSGEGMREVRGSLTAEWSARQRAYELSTRRQVEEEQGYHYRSIRGVSSPHSGSGGGRYRTSPPAPVEQPHPSHQPHSSHHHLHQPPQSQLQLQVQPRTPTLIRHSSRERFTPYAHPPAIPPSSTRHHTLMRPFNSPHTSGGGRSRSVSTPHYPPQPYVRGERGHVSQASHSSSNTQASSGAGGRLGGGSTSSTPTTAGTSVSPPGRSPSTTTIPSYGDNHNIKHSSQQLRRASNQIEIENLAQSQTDQRKFSPMDLRSLTTSNLVNTTNTAVTSDVVAS